MCYFSPRKQTWSRGNFPSDGVPWNQLCWKTHNCPRFEKEDNMNETEATLWRYHCDGWMKSGRLSRCFKSAYGGKSSTFWTENSPRIKAPYPKLMNLVSIYLEKIFYPIQQKSMAFNQECRWNYGSKSLHSFWATLYNNTSCRTPCVNRQKLDPCNIVCPLHSASHRSF